VTLGRFLIVFSAVMAIWFAWMSWMRPADYCPSTSRYVSRQEVLASAVMRHADKARGLPGNPTLDDIYSFLEQHPDCCVVMRAPPFPEGALDRLFGTGTWVHTVFEMKPEKIRKGQPNDVAYDAFVNVDACGRSRDAPGIPITLAEMQRQILANRAAR
jgi:hypothetical protein